jgi:hypothetical protein
VSAASGHNGHRPDATDILSGLDAEHALRTFNADTRPDTEADSGPDIRPDSRTDTARTYGPDEVSVRRPASWTAAELMTAEFPPPKWAVPGIIPEGATLLVGAPKTGKSWLALGLAVAVATGGKALGSIEVDPGPVLYLALEDTPRRLQDRLSKVLAGAAPPPGLRFAVNWPPLAAGGEVLLDEWLALNPAARLVIIDVLAKVRPPMAALSAYEADYRAVGAVKVVADAHQVAAVLVHHDRKLKSDDFLADVSGTNGLAGAADAVAVLRRVRGKADGVLHVTGRDVEETGHTLAFDADLGAWLLTGTPVEDLTLTDTRAAITRYLRANPGAGPRQVADGAGIAYELAKKTLPRMATDGQADTDGQGHYFLPAASTS